jgi:hypothetical protein
MAVGSKDAHGLGVVAEGGIATAAELILRMLKRGRSDIIARR